MKKKFTLEIVNSCTENFDNMIPNANGSFCNSCVKNVIDLSSKTNTEIARFASENKNKTVCARLKTTQLEQEFVYNETSKINNFKYAAAVAASVLLTSNVLGQEKPSVQTEINSVKSEHFILGKVAYNETAEEQVSIVVKGKIIDSKTNKPLDKKMYPKIVFSLNGSESIIKVNAKTGDFTASIKILKTDKTIGYTVSSGDYFLSKTLEFDIKSVKENVLQQNIEVDPEEFRKIYVMGGLGINYSEIKVTKEISSNFGKQKSSGNSRAYNL